MPSTNLIEQSINEKPLHLTYLHEFRTEQCKLFLKHKCNKHRPYTCFYWHFMNQRRRRPIKNENNSFNYHPDIYCTKYDEATGICPIGDNCPFLHRTSGDTERRYHLRYYKTEICVHETDSKGFCSKNGVHCAFAHGLHDTREPLFGLDEKYLDEFIHKIFTKDFLKQGLLSLLKEKLNGAQDLDKKSFKNQDCSADLDNLQYLITLDHKIPESLISVDKIFEIISFFINSIKTFSNENCLENLNQGNIDNNNLMVKQNLLVKDVLQQSKLFQNARQLQYVKKRLQMLFVNGGNSSNPNNDNGDVAVKLNKLCPILLLEKDRKLQNEDLKWRDGSYVLVHYKTELCVKPPRLCRQGYACPAYHNDKDRRRSPNLFKYRSTPCPSVKHGDEWGDPNSCENGDECPYCHTRTEQQFHPEIFKTTKCNDIIQTGYCPRGPFCAFAHIDQELSTERKIINQMMMGLPEPNNNVMNQAKMNGLCNNNVRPSPLLWQEYSNQTKQLSNGLFVNNNINNNDLLLGTNINNNNSNSAITNNYALRGCMPPPPPPANVNQLYPNWAVESSNAGGNIPRSFYNYTNSSSSLNNGGAHNSLINFAENSSNRTTTTNHVNHHDGSVYYTKKLIDILPPNQTLQMGAIAANLALPQQQQQLSYQVIPTAVRSNHHNLSNNLNAALPQPPSLSSYNNIINMTGINPKTLPNNNNNNNNNNPGCFTKQQMGGKNGPPFLDVPQLTYNYDNTNDASAANNRNLFNGNSKWTARNNQFNSFHPTAPYNNPMNLGKGFDWTLLEDESVHLKAAPNNGLQQNGSDGVFNGRLTNNNYNNNALNYSHNVIDTFKEPSLQFPSHPPNPNLVRAISDWLKGNEKAASNMTDNSGFKISMPNFIVNSATAPAVDPANLGLASNTDSMMTPDKYKNYSPELSSFLSLFPSVSDQDFLVAKSKLMHSLENDSNVNRGNEFDATILGSLKDVNQLLWKKNLDDEGSLNKSCGNVFVTPKWDNMAQKLLNGDTEHEDLLMNLSKLLEALPASCNGNNVDAHPFDGIGATNHNCSDKSADSSSHSKDSIFVDSVLTSVTLDIQPSMMESRETTLAAPSN